MSIELDNLRKSYTDAVAAGDLEAAAAYKAEASSLYNEQTKLAAPDLRVEVLETLKKHYEESSAAGDLKASETYKADAAEMYKAIQEDPTGADFDWARFRERFVPSVVEMGEDIAGAAEAAWENYPTFREEPIATIQKYAPPVAEAVGDFAMDTGRWVVDKYNRNVPEAMQLQAYNEGLPVAPGELAAQHESGVIAQGIEDKYGTWNKAKRTIEEDPAGVIVDAAAAAYPAYGVAKAGTAGVKATVAAAQPVAGPLLRPVARALDKKINSGPEDYLRRQGIGVDDSGQSFTDMNTVRSNIASNKAFNESYVDYENKIAWFDEQIGVAKKAGNAKQFIKQKQEFVKSTNIARHKLFNDGLSKIRSMPDSPEKTKALHAWTKNRKSILHGDLYSDLMTLDSVDLGAALGLITMVGATVGTGGGAAAAGWILAADVFRKVAVGVYKNKEELGRRVAEGAQSAKDVALYLPNKAAEGAKAGTIAASDALSDYTGLHKKAVDLELAKKRKAEQAIKGSDETLPLTTQLTDDELLELELKTEIIRRRNSKAQQVDEGVDTPEPDVDAIARQAYLEKARGQVSDEEIAKYTDVPAKPKQNRSVTDAKDRDPSLPPTTKLGVVSDKVPEYDRRHDVPVVGDLDPVNPSTKGAAAGKKAEVYESIIDDAYGNASKRKNLEKYGEFGLDDDGLKMSKEQYEWERYQDDITKWKDPEKQQQMRVIALQQKLRRRKSGNVQIERALEDMETPYDLTQETPPKRVSWKQHQKDLREEARAGAAEDAKIASGGYKEENLAGEVVVNPALEKMFSGKIPKAETAKQTVKTQFVGAELNSAQREANTKHLVTVNKQINTEKKNLRNLKSRLITKETTQVDSDRLPPKEAGAWLKDRQKIRANEVKEIKDKIKALETERENVPFKRTKQETPAVLTKTERKEAAAWLKDNITQTKTAKAELAAIKKKKLFTPKEITGLSTLSPGERAARKRQRQAWKDEDIKLVEEKIAWLENDRKNPPYSDRLKPKNPDGKPLNMGGRDSEFAANKMMHEGMDDFTGPKLTKKGLDQKRRFDKVDFYDRKRAQEKLDRMSKTEAKDLGLPSKDGLAVRDLTPEQFSELLGKRKPLNLGGRDSEFGANKMMRQGMD